MTCRWIILVTLAAVLSVVAAFAVTRRMIARPIHRRCETPALLNDAAYLERALNLTPMQKEQVAALHAELRATLEECCKRHCAARIRLGRALRGDLDEDVDFDDLIREMCVAYAASEQATLAHIAHLRELLTAEQRTSFDEMLADKLCSACPACAEHAAQTRESGRAGTAVATE